MEGIEPSTSSLPRKCSATELQRPVKNSRNFKKNRAEDRARTGHPQLGRLTLYQMSYFRLFFTIYDFVIFCGERRIRTSEVERRQIYSLIHLATLESPQTNFYKIKILFKFKELLRADGGIRTPDQLITNQLLWPTELHRLISLLFLKDLFFYTKNAALF